MKKKKRLILPLMVLAISVALAACSNGKAANEKVVIYTNGDEAASTAMNNALNDAGYEGKYIMQSLGTSELGGKMLAEGNKIEADIITMSNYFIDSAEKQHNMFKDLTFNVKALDEHPKYSTPILSNTGAIFVNTEVLKSKNLKQPTSLKDLAEPEYKGLVSIPNIMDSSTGWLLVQALLNEYGESEGRKILNKLIANCGPHLESSGSGPIKKVQAGEVAAGFGLRYAAVVAQESGLPIQYIDPIEGNFSLTESIAVVNKDSGKSKLAMEMAETIVKDARKELLVHYPVAQYEGETIDEKHKPAHAMKFDQALTVELLKQHQTFFESAKN